MPAEVRPATREDADSIARFQVLMAKETEDKPLDPETVLVAVKAVFDDPQKGFYLVGVIEGTVISSLLITFEWSDWRNTNIWYFQSVFVEREYRGQGVFRKMYQTVVEQARQNDVKHLRLYVETDNHRAQEIYQSLGMKRMPYFMYDAEIAES
jgi:ribosomal protein S18 acetylase RimI-like enzyme